MRFSYTICHVPGKELYTVDALSRAPLPTSDDAQTEHIEQFVSTVVSALPASTDWLQEYRTAQLTNPVCADLVKLCQKGWPQNKRQVPAKLQPYWPV